jgi:hypothetical protein
VAYLSHSPSSSRAGERKLLSLNWRLIFVLAANTLGWLAIAFFGLRAL